MSDLNVSNDIFTENVSRDFKNKIARKKIEIPNYSRAQLVNEKEHLELRKFRMNDRLGEDLFSEHQKSIYKIYLQDVEDLINAIDARLSELAGGARTRTSRRRKGYKRKSIRRRRKSIRRRTRK